MLEVTVFESCTVAEAVTPKTWRLASVLGRARLGRVFHGGQNTGSDQTPWQAPSNVKRFYLTALTAEYTPTNLRGAWDHTSSAVTKKLSPYKNGGGLITNISVSETSSSTEYDILYYRGVTVPLPAQTISGEVSAAAMVIDGGWARDNTYFHLHIYVTQGDTDSVRGTLLSDHREAEVPMSWASVYYSFSTTNQAKFTPVTAQAGDRIVVELGLVTRDASTGSRNLGMQYGTASTDDEFSIGDRDAVRAKAGVTNQYSNYTGWIEFLTDDPLDLDPGNVSVDQVVVEAVQAQVATVGVDQVVVEVLQETTTLGGGNYERATVTERVIRGSSKLVFETLSVADFLNTSLSQLCSETITVTEAVITGIPAEVYVSQLALELADQSPAPTRVSQLALELADQSPAPTRVSQVGIELADQSPAPVRVSQLGIELLVMVGESTPSETVTVAEGVTVECLTLTRARVTQALLEVALSGAATARVTQALLEVAILAFEAVDQSASDSVAVLDDPTPGLVAHLISDIQQGTWTPSTGTDLYPMVNDLTDVTYIISAANPVNDTAILGVAPLDIPEDGILTLEVRSQEV